MADSRRYLFSPAVMMARIVRIVAQRRKRRRRGMFLVRCTLKTEPAIS